MKTKHENNDMTRLQYYRELYQKYLTTPTTQWNGVVALPTKLKTSNAIFALGDALNHDIGSEIEAFIRDNKKVWIWSDIHFNHKNICSHANRPYQSMEEMHNALLNNYRSVVGDDDLVIWGGDISFGNVQEINQIIDDLPGRKALILGNHDFDHRKMKPLNYSCFDLTNSLATFVCNGQEYVVTHYPIDLNHLPQDTVNIHGHTHQHSMGVRRLNMSVENTNYQPVPLLDFIGQ